MAEYIGGGISSSGSTSSPAAPHVTENPAPLPTTQPPTSNSGSDDPTAGIPAGSGGVSSTADIGSPVGSAEQKTVIGSVLESVGLVSKKERTAEEADAQNSSNIAATPSTAAQNGQENSGTIVGALTGVAAAGTAAVASVIPGMSSQTGTSQDAAASSTQSAGNAATTTTGPSTTTTGTTGASTTGTTSVAGEKTVGEQAQEAGEAVKETANQAAQSASETANQVAESANKTANQAGEAVKESTTENKETEEGGEKPKEVSDHAAAVRENKEAIPTAGGERLGEAHEGESKIIPENPKPQPEEEVPGKDSATQANTKANTPDAPADAKPKKRMSILGGKKDESGADKPKFFDRLKNKFGGNKENKS